MATPCSVALAGSIGRRLVVGIEACHRDGGARQDGAGRIDDRHDERAGLRGRLGDARRWTPETMQQAEQQA